VEIIRALRALASSSILDADITQKILRLGRERVAKYSIVETLEMAKEPVAFGSYYVLKSQVETYPDSGIK